NNARDQCVSAGIPIQHFNKLNDATFAIKRFGIGASILFSFTKVIDRNSNSFIEICEFPQSSFENIFLEDGSGENRSVGPKVNSGPGLVTCSNFTNWVSGDPNMIFLFEDFPFAFNNNVAR